MRIGFIEDTPLHGGTQIWVVEAAKVFIGKGHDVTVLAPHDTWVSNECKKTGAKVVTYDYEKVIDEPAGEMQIWGDALKDCDVAVCTVHPPRKGFHCSVFGTKVIKHFNLPTILVPKTGTIVPEYKKEFYFSDPCINTHVITITDFARRYLIEEYGLPEEKVDLIYQGTDISSFTPSEGITDKAKELYPLFKNSYPVIGCVGSFERRKGQSVLFEALKKIIAGPFPDIHLMIVGDGPDEEMLKRKRIDMNLENNITFFPFTREPVYIYGRMDILALPSLYKEGLPNVLLEAMAMGIPVVASKMAGVPELVLDGETGYMVEPGQVDQLSEGLIKLASDKGNLKKIGDEARRYVISNFDKRKQFNVFLGFFEKLKKMSENRKIELR
jgi:glycosyltransferase involved in cell wall biosynthesis